MITIEVPPEKRIWSCVSVVFHPQFLFFTPSLLSSHPVYHVEVSVSKTSNCALPRATSPVSVSLRVDGYFIQTPSISSWNVDSCHTLHVLPPPMATSSSTLGVCPFCGSTLAAGSIILEYEVDGEHRVYAGCSECNEPVHPE